VAGLSGKLCKTLLPDRNYIYSVIVKNEKADQIGL